MSEITMEEVYRLMREAVRLRDIADEHPDDDHQELLDVEDDLAVAFMQYLSGADIAPVGVGARAFLHFYRHEQEE